jgi:hypothetical protein
MELPGECQRVLRLVQAYFASTGEPDIGDRPPPFFVNFRTGDTLRLERRYFGLQIVTHEVEFVPAILFGGMNRRFRRRQGEDQPSVACVYRGKSEGLPQESAISLRILAEYHYMDAKDHPLLLSLPPGILPYGARCFRHCSKTSYLRSGASPSFSPKLHLVC